MILYINGIDKTSLLLKESLYIRRSIGNAVDVCDIVLLDTTNTFYTQQNDYVVIEEDSENIFAGYVIASVGNKLGVGSAGSTSWKLTCKDVSMLLDTETVDKAYVGEADSTILSDLMTTYLLTYGFSVSSDVVSISSDVDIEFKQETVRECLNKLAAQLQTYWYIDSDKALHWKDFSSLSYAPASINSESYDSVTVYPPLQTAKIGLDSSNIINKVSIYGGTNENSALIEESFTADANNVYQLASTNIFSVYSVTWTYGATNFTRYGTAVTYAGQSTDTSAILKCNQSTGRVTFLNFVPDVGTTITVSYYSQDEIFYEANDYISQGTYGIFERIITDTTLTAQTEAEAKAQAVIDEYSTARETLTVDVLTSGFSPGDIISVSIPALNITSVETGNLLQEDSYDLLLESGDLIALENYNQQILRQIQQVIVRYVGAENQIASTLVIGKTTNNLIKTLSGLQSLSNSQPNRFTPARLSYLSNDLGQVTAGLGIFTDGGTAQFTWADYAGHTGVVVGLEEVNDNAYGVLTVIESGTEKVRVGRLNNLPTLGTVQPTGWGIYTQNGYFSGVVVASELIGGTITGNIINGGTVTGSLISGGTVSGVVVTGNTIIGGTIATSTPPINSSNPGVIMDSTGLYGYGSAGLTFRLSSDPAIKPYFSSGTILDTVYEINTAAVLRTGTTNPRVQIDNSGIFAYDSGGVLRFTVDVATGQLTASKGTFSGTVSASVMTAGTVTGSLVTAGTVTGNLVTAGTITSNQITSGTITGNRITAGTITGVTITANNISGGTVSGGLISGGTVTGSYISGGTITGGAITTNTLTGGTITGARITAGTITGVAISANSISGGTITAAILSGGNMSNGTLSAASISGGTLTAGLISGGTISAGFISGGTISSANFSGSAVVTSGFKFVSGVGTALTVYAGSVVSETLAPVATSDTLGLATTNQGWSTLFLRDSIGGISVPLTCNRTGGSVYLFLNGYQIAQVAA